MNPVWWFLIGLVAGFFLTTCVVLILAAINLPVDGARQSER